MYSVLKPLPSFLICTLAYAGIGILKDCITASSGYLSDLGYFTPDQYSIFVSIGYVAQAITRLFSGVIIDCLDQPKQIYLAAALFSIAGIITNTFIEKTSPVYWFGIIYVVVKISASFFRFAVMKILGNYYEGKAFGSVNNLLGGIGCLYSAGCMAMMTWFYQHDWSWKNAWYLFVGIAILTNIPFIFVGYNPSPFRTFATTKEDLKQLFRNPRYYLLLAMSCAISVMRVATSFIPWYFMVMLERDSIETPALASILFLTGVFGVFIGAALNRLPNRYHNLCAMIGLVCSVIAVIILYVSHKHGQITYVQGMAAMAVMIFGSTPLDTYIDGTYARELSTPSTQSTALATSSAFGFMAASITAILVQNQIASPLGWCNILLIQMIAGLVLFILSTIYICNRP